jgi:hypothetical protein
MGCGADTEANALITSLTAGEDFTIPKPDLSGDEFKFPYDPNSPLYKGLKPLTNEDVTTRVIDGTGSFDSFMSGFNVHLWNEYDKGRITGAEYTKAYVALAESAMSQGVQFLLGKDQAFWQGQQAQIQAFTARVQLETAKVALASEQLQVANQKANYALTKLKLASESVTYCTAQYNLDNMLPQQLANLRIQAKLLSEQMEAQRAQTSDSRSDNLPVLGLIGQQKKLYAQQVTSYQRDSEVKASKLFTDAWITMKTIDEGLNPPNGFTNASLDTILLQLKANNGLG